MILATIDAWGLLGIWETDWRLLPYFHGSVEGGRCHDRPEFWVCPADSWNWGIMSLAQEILSDDWNHRVNWQDRRTFQSSSTVQWLFSSSCHIFILWSTKWSRQFSLSTSSIIEVCLPLIQTTCRQTKSVEIIRRVCHQVTMRIWDKPCLYHYRSSEKRQVIECRGWIMVQSGSRHGIGKVRLRFSRKCVNEFIVCGRYRGCRRWNQECTREQVQLGNSIVT